MRSTHRTVAALAIAAAMLLATGCSSSSKDSDGTTTIKLLTDDSSTTTAPAKAVIQAFEAANPTIKVELVTRPSGTDGDNVVKTKLSTGDMEDVFWYNSGSLLQALDPTKTLVDLTNTAALADTESSFLPSVTVDGKVYGAPWGDSSGGGILYNKAVYAKLGLQVPTTWAQFESNADKIKAAGITAVLGSFADTWTTQLFVLGDYCNVVAQEPDWATQYTDNKVKYATDAVARRGFEKTAEVKAKGWLNSDAGSMTEAQGMAALVAGQAANYPMLTFPVASLSASDAANIGFFGIPGDDASKSCATLWMPNGQYIPQTTKHQDAALKFVAFTASPAGVAAYWSAQPPTAPSMIKGVTLPSTAPAVATDIQAYITKGNNSAALEFFSAVKGPNLEQITTAVESGQTSAADGASQYDADVVKQAQQLGLKGW